MSDSTRGGRRQTRGGGSPRRRGIPGIITGAVVVVLVLGLILSLRGAGVLSGGPNTTPAPGTPGPTLALPTLAPDDPARGKKAEDLGNNHVASGSTVNYPSLPPTSGPHWGSPAAPRPAGVYDTQLPFEATVHNLEHGGVVIVYNNLSSDEVTRLTTLVRSIIGTTPYKKVLVMPFTGLTGAKVAATAWDWRLDLQSVDQPSILKFIEAHYDNAGNAPEPGTPW